MVLNRADIKLLTECGYSGLLRNIDASVTPIFEALDIWLPDQAAGPIGLALEAMIAGRFGDAEDILVEAMGSRKGSQNELRAILAMCKALQRDTGAVEQLAGSLKGTGGSAEGFVSALMGIETNRMQPPDQRTAKVATG